MKNFITSEPEHQLYVNSLDLDIQFQHCVGPDTGPNCLQSLSADNISRKKHKVI